MQILFEDNHILAVVKPANTPSQDDPTGDTSMLEIGRAYLQEKQPSAKKAYIGLVHRLDRPVEGAMLFAKTPASTQRLSEQFRDSTTEKLYLALVSGTPKETKADLTHYIAKHTKNRVGAYATHAQGRKKADLSYEVLKSDEKISLVRIHLKTGRKHQIRAQFASIGHPIVGDRKYGGRIKFQGDGIALLSHSIAFKHPTKEKTVFVESPSNKFFKNYQGLIPL